MPEDQIVDVENPVVRNVIRICRVPDSLSKEKPDPYKPVEVSIGPYHKDDPHLQPMQHHKERYLKLLIERRNNFLKRSVENEEFVRILKAKLNEIKSKARDCYDKSSIKNSTSGVDFLESDEFVTMMLLDGCFVIEFLRKMDHGVNEVLSDENGPAPTDQSKIYRLMCDMMLAENQLPYFLLTVLYDMTKCGEEKCLEEMAMSCFNILLPRPRLYFSSVGEIQSWGEEINHLLHLVHIFCRPSIKERNHKKTTKRVSGSNDNNWDDPKRSLLQMNHADSAGSSNERTPKDNIRSSTVNEKSYELTDKLRAVVELQDAGIKFERVGKVYNGQLLSNGTKKDYVSLFDIDFKCWAMKVPCFKVDDSTRILLQNLIAFEQQNSLHINPKYFTDFAILMNQLIDSKDDAHLLRSQKIIISFLGNDDDLSELFNGLTEGITESYEAYYLKVCKKVEKHCESNFNKLMAKLKNEYFNNPWAGVSTVAAVILFLIGILQTVAAFK